MFITKKDLEEYDKRIKAEKTAIDNNLNKKSNINYLVTICLLSLSILLVIIGIKYVKSDPYYNWKETDRLPISIGIWIISFALFAMSIFLSIKKQLIHVKKNMESSVELKKDTSLLKTIIICITVIISSCILSYSIYQSNRYHYNYPFIIDKYSGKYKTIENP